MQGTYEHWRDNYKIPSCWRVLNDDCIPHFHSSIELVYVTGGKLKATLNGVSYTAGENQILISSSYTVHRYETETYSDAIVLTVPLYFIPAYDKILAHSCFAQNLYKDDEPESEILHCLNVLSHEGAGAHKLSENILKGYIYVIVGMLIDRVGLVPIEDEPNRSLTKEILIYLQNNYLCPVSLETLSRDFGYSQSRFSHIFNTYFSCSIAEYVGTLRCRHAASLLTNNSIPITDAAMSSGFESMRTFYRSFKHCFGITPSQYRTNCARA